MPQYVLLDRDGVINRKAADGYVTSWHDFEFLPGVLEALHLLKVNGYKALVISNQAAVGRKIMTTAMLSNLTRRFLQQVQKNGGQIHGVYYCPHTAEDDCNCRKPRPGLFLKAQREHRFAFADTFFIGDSESDALAAQSVGCPFIRLLGSETREMDGRSYSHEPVFPSLLKAVNFILASRESRNRRVQLVTQ
jgi:D-glycero-D-manno-heptose 1,7-bisphosphate phosphatase